MSPTRLLDRPLAPPRLTCGEVVPVVELLVCDPHGAQRDRLQTHVDDVLELRPQRLVVDLRGCRALDGAALRVLLDAHCEQRRRGGLLVLRGPSARVVQLIHLSGLQDVFDLEQESP